MTREEAIVYIIEQPNGYVVPQDIYDLIDTIYDSFESRTCENCKNYSEGWCDILSQDVAKFSYFAKDFSCNKWEATEKDLL